MKKGIDAVSLLTWMPLFFVSGLLFDDKRFEKEIKGLVPAEMKENVNVIAKENRENSAWIGGSIYSSLPLMKDLWLTKDEYMEYGSEYANTKYQKK